VVSSGQVSISYLQRKLRVGFSRAARLVDMMEADGLVSAGAAGKPAKCWWTGPTSMRSTAICASALALALLTAVATTAAAQSAPDGAALFKEASTREAALRRELSAAKSGATAVTQRRVRTLVGAFEDLARLYPAAGQADKALWQGASLSADLFFQAGDELDRDRALQMLSALQKAFPGSSYARQGVPLARRLEGAPRAVRAPAAPPPPAQLPAAPSASTPTAPPAAAAPAARPGPRAQTGPETAAAGVLLTAVRRELLPEGVRITLELDREVAYHSERIQGPERVFVDLPHTRAVPALKFAVLPFEDGVVRRARVGAHPDGITRVRARSRRRRTPQYLHAVQTRIASWWTSSSPPSAVRRPRRRPHRSQPRRPSWPPHPPPLQHRRPPPSGRRWTARWQRWPTSWTVPRCPPPQHRPPRVRRRRLRRPSTRGGDSRCHGSSGSGSRGSSSTPATAATTRAHR
jgi:hypothetical protein